MIARRLSRRSVLAGAPAGLLAGRDAAAQRVDLKFATAAEGGNFIVYGGAFTDALKWANPSMQVRVLKTRGSAENVPLLEAGEVDIGLVSGEMAEHVFNNPDGPPTRLKVICAAYSSPGMFVVRADTRYHSIASLKDRRVVWNGRGSGLALQGRYVVQALGLDPDKDFDSIYTESLTDGPTLILEGRAAALWGSGNRWPGFVKVATDLRGARFVVPDAGEIGRIIAAHPFMRRFIVPARRYPGQYDPLVTVGSWSYVLARPFLDDAVGYWVAAALNKVEGATLLSFTDLLAESTARNTLAALPRPDALQGGVELYFRELGLLQ